MNMLAWCSEIKKEVEMLGSVCKTAENNAETADMLACTCQDHLYVEQCGRFWSDTLKGTLILKINTVSIQC